jgi:protein-disulfide isomerase
MSNASKAGNTIIAIAVVIVTIGAGLVLYSIKWAPSSASEAPAEPATASADAATNHDHDHGHAHAAKPNSTKTFDPSALADSSFDIVIGNPDAPVTMVEYASLSCPHCAKFHNEVVPALKKDLVSQGDLRIVFRHFPLNAPALKAAQAVECTPADKRPALLEHFFKTQGDWAFNAAYKEAISAAAIEHGASATELEACMNDADIENRILQTRQVAENRLLVDSTPTMFVGTERFLGQTTAEKMIEAVNNALAKTTPKSAE